jgi:hypothetical protein
MPTELFKARTQYNDFVGTSAADGADVVDFEKWMRKNGHMRDGELLVGIELWAGEYHGEQKDPVHVNALLMQPGDHDSVKAAIEAAKGPIPVRQESIEMNLKDFFALFKRFSVSFSRRGLLSPGVEYAYAES